MRLHTHEHPDLDALFSLAAARRYIPDAKDAEVQFHPASWDGAEMEPGDIAVDMEAGGSGWKGEKEETGSGVIVHSCFAYIMLRYAPTTDCLALAPIISYVDMCDAHGNIVRHLALDMSPENRAVLSAGSLTATLMWLKAIHNGDALKILSELERFFEGMLKVGYDCLKAEKKARKAEFFADGQVALMDYGKSERSVPTNALFALGVRVIVFRNGYGAGVMREQMGTLRMDHPRFRAVVEAVGEEVGDGPGKWFAHPNGFLFANGTPKSPAKTPSKVNPLDLVRAAVELLAEYDAAKRQATVS